MTDQRTAPDERPDEDAATPPSAWTAFGLGAHAVDDRLRLFSWATGQDRFLYLWSLRVFDQARQAYQVRLTVADVATGLGRLAAEHPQVPAASDLAASLDALVDWGVLDRSQESGRVASIAEYRRRNSVYQLTELGFIAHAAVERVVSARPDDAQLRAIALGAILEDLDALAAANRAGDAVRVHRLLDRLHGVLTDMAERAARFYLMIGELSRVEEARPEVFLRHKDLLLAHLRDFHAELQRYGPLIAAAVAEVRASGEESLVDLAAQADPAPFATPVERVERWRGHWEGLVAWFVPTAGQPATVERLDARTTGAIADLAALLRQVTEARRSGVSRDSQLRDLAAWCWAVPSDPDAAALWSAASGLRSARHLSLALDDADAVRADRSWSVAPPVAVSTTLREHGRASSPGRPQPLRDDAAARQAGRERQVAARALDAEAAAALAAADFAGHVLGPAETALLLRLLDRALQSRSVVSGRVHGAGVHSGVRLRLRPSPAASVVRTSTGVLTVPDVAVEVEPAPLGGTR
ncbi:MAG: TIGR02677 family protein [Acidimicrobiales bacterium]